MPFTHLYDILPFVLFIGLVVHAKALAITLTYNNTNKLLDRGSTQAKSWEESCMGKLLYS